jgi:hypothetical protein
MMVTVRERKFERMVHDHACTGFRTDGARERMKSIPTALEDTNTTTTGFCSGI